MKMKDIIAVADCDSFFVSCEQNENPSLWNKPVCVLGNNDRCVVARSREAKKVGVRMGMPYFQAIKEFPGVVYLSGHIDLYAKKSKQIMTILKNYVPEMEQYSIDEAFLNYKGIQKLYNKDPYELSVFLRKELKEKTGIPVSIGVSTSKTLAKIASHRAKNNGTGICVIDKLSEKELLELSINDIWGFGRRLVPKLKQYGITNAFEFINMNSDLLAKLLGKRGTEIKDELLGKYVYKIDTEVSLPKSIQKTNSFPQFSSDKTYIKNELHRHIHTACKKLRNTDIENVSLKCLSVELMLKTKDFQYFCKKCELSMPTNWELDIIVEVDKMLEELYIPNIVYRACGIVLFNLINDSKNQLSFFDMNELGKPKSQNLGKCIDKLEEKFGKNIIKIGITT